MKRFLLIACIMLASTLFTTWAQERQRYEIQVGDFNKMYVADDLNVVYRCNADSAGMAVIISTPKEKQALLFRNKYSTLIVQMSTDYALSSHTMPPITIYSSKISKIENSADSTVYVDGVTLSTPLELKLTDNGTIVARDISITELNAKVITGKGLIELSGKCDKASLRCTGTGKIKANNLIATNVTCMILGTGSISCYVNGGELVTKGSGPGRVYFDGTPSEIKSRHIGRLKTIPYKEEEVEESPADSTLIIPENSTVKPETGLDNDTIDFNEI